MLTLEQYKDVYGVSERTIYRHIEKGTVLKYEQGGETYLISTEAERHSGNTIKVYQQAKMEEWNKLLQKGVIIYQRNEGACKETTEIINLIEADVKKTQIALGVKIKGYDRRSLQIKIKKNKVTRKTRDDKYRIRNKALKNQETFNKALELISSYYIQDPLISLGQAIDKAIYTAKQNEEYWEVAGVNIHTLRRHISRAYKQSGMKTLCEYMNHYNNFRTKLTYVPGAFTRDIEFFDVLSLDDHKFDVAGALVWNEKSGEFEQKKIFSWVMVEMKTMQILSYKIQAQPFKEDDVYKVILQGLRRFGKPNNKIICDQGLAASDRIAEGLARIGVILEAQKAYTPTAKANNERIFKMFKNEEDIYNENFTGSNHPVEGRHRGLKLSPEQTDEMIETAITRYDRYITGYYQERPRLRQIEGIEALTDNTGRVAIKALFNYYMEKHTIDAVSDMDVRKAYMKFDMVKNFKNFYIKFNKDIYIPTTATTLTIHDPEYKYIVAYFPDSMSHIDLYAAQDIQDRLSGELIEKGQFVCTLEALDILSSEDKKMKVGQYNSRIKKALRELAKGMREAHSSVNQAVTESGEIVNLRKIEEKRIERIIKERLPLTEIDKAIIKANTEQTEPTVEIEKEFESGFESLNNIKIGDESK